ncbi:MAG: PRTRC system protein C [Tannerellaceae bacterium]|jgi:PRTRC genetic system protein C|nr:PRTRC system protein C [Tannerellaceae bacterium]
MALDVRNLERVFRHGNLELSDPDTSLSPDEVMSFYANTYPELTTSTIQGPKMEEGRAAYEFKTTVGVKG